MAEELQAPESFKETMAAVLADQEAAAAADPAPEPAPVAAEPTDAEPVPSDAGAGEASEPEPDGVPGTADGDTAPSQEAAESSAPALEAPNHWKAEHKAKFGGLSDEDKAWVLEQRKADDQSHRKKMFEVDRLERQSAVLAKAIEPFADQIARSGQTPEQAIATLAAFHGQLQTEPAAALAKMAQLYASPSAGEGTRRQVAQQVLQAVGLHPDALLEEQLDVDPTAATLTADIDRRFQEFEAKQQQRSQLDQQTSVQEMINTFKAETTPEGKPAHPHFDALETTMENLLIAKRAANLGEAYSLALSLTPELQPKAPRKVATTVASSVPKTSPAPGSKAPSPLPRLRDHMRAVAEEQGWTPT